jgi:hypothetical protein
MHSYQARPTLSEMPEEVITLIELTGTGSQAQVHVNDEAMENLRWTDQALQ